MLIIYNKKRREKSSEVKYTTSTIKALKTRYIALKTTQKSKIILTLLFYSYFKSNKERAYTLSLHYLPPILLLKKFVILNCSFKFIKMKILTSRISTSYRSLFILLTRKQSFPPALFCF